MCVVQCSQKQKREREKENATTRKECSRYYLVLLYVRLSLVDLFFSRVHRALFEETLKAFLWRCDEVLFFLLLCVSFFKIFSRICLMLMRLKKTTVWPKKKKFASSSSKKISKRGVSVKYAATKNNDDDEYDGWCWTTGVSSGEVLEKKTWRCVWKG